MWDYGLPVLYTLFVWWFSTGLILYLDGLPRGTFRWSLVGATALLILGLYGLAASQNDTSVFGAYVAFTSGVLVWGWQEVGFLMGFITGPRRDPCPIGCSGWRHLGHAIQAMLYHELSLAAAAGAVIALTWSGTNQVGTWTFLILWGMRESAKLNMFLGVRNLNEEFLPDHLQFLRSFFRRKAMNLLFPVSITVSMVIVTLLVREALAVGSSDFDAAGYAFLGTLMTLAILEHWFLVLPIPTASLWRWGLRSREVGRGLISDGLPTSTGSGEATFPRERLSAVPVGPRKGSALEDTNTRRAAASGSGVCAGLAVFGSETLSGASGEAGLACLRAGDVADRQPDNKSKLSKVACRFGSGALIP
ncbi:MAG: putative photosynthetic complex assembly protein PuhE [Rhodocyclaceae bacterium]